MGGAQEELGTPIDDDPLDPGTAESLQLGGYRFERNLPSYLEYNLDSARCY